MNKYAICGLLMAAMSMQVMAQGGTKSPYSQYGLGVLSDHSQAANRGMNGIGLAFRQSTLVNTLNPASYSSVDSLTMLFDVGMSLQTTNFKEGARKVNANTASVEYAVASFRLLPHVGMAFGILPLTNVGYDYAVSSYLDQTNGFMSENYSGSGGLHQAFIGAGWQPASFLSVGANVAYLWGGYDRTVTTSGASNVASLKRVYSANVNSYKIDLGLQLYKQLGMKDMATLGATVGLGHKLGEDATLEQINLGNADTTRFVAADAIELPMTYGVGFAWTHANKWMIGTDFSMQKWGNIGQATFDGSKYTIQKGLLSDRYELKVGGEWVPNEASRSNFLKRIHYRLGAGYATPYYKVNGQDGPKEYSISAGLGIPLQNQWSAKGRLRPVLNISAQWLHASVKDLITENTFRINVALTFNERWFAKWKVE